eukprot:380225-Rhodomonas_salina.2
MVGPGPWVQGLKGRISKEDLPELGKDRGRGEGQRKTERGVIAERKVEGGKGGRGSEEEAERMSRRGRKCEE